ncbi:MAG: hypothetical protein IMW91_01820 [Firmicutes bacterium]|nr:hypothetical protein [Bacillota bacterium]
MTTTYERFTKELIEACDGLSPVTHVLVETEQQLGAVDLQRSTTFALQRDEEDERYAQVTVTPLGDAQMDVAFEVHLPLPPGAESPRWASIYQAATELSDAIEMNVLSTWDEEAHQMVEDELLFVGGYDVSFDGNQNDFTHAVETIAREIDAFLTLSLRPERGRSESRTTPAYS